MLAAGVSTTFGDAAPARDIAAALLDATLELEAAPAEPGLRRAALELLADALYRAAPEPLIEKLRRAAVPAAEPGPVRLPMASPSRAGQELGPWLRSLLRGEPTEPPGAELGGAAHLFRRDPDAAWAEWRASLAGGLEAGPAGPGTWDAADPRHGSVAPATSALLIGLAFGLLGMSPDAGVGRIRLAPRFPSHLLRFAVSGVPLGAAKLEMLYERDGGGHRFTLTPTRAAVPPTVVFEPGVPGGVRAVRIDGEAAELECREERGRTVVPAQLSLDGARSVEVLSGEGSQSVSTTM